jgi:hypothetical protein
MRLGIPDRDGRFEYEKEEEEEEYQSLRRGADRWWELDGWAQDGGGVRAGWAKLRADDREKAQVGRWRRHWEAKEEKLMWLMDEVRVFFILHHPLYLEAELVAGGTLHTRLRAYGKGGKE